MNIFSNLIYCCIIKSKNSSHFIIFCCRFILFSPLYVVVAIFFVAAFFFSPLYFFFAALFYFYRFSFFFVAALFCCRRYLFVAIWSTKEIKVARKKESGDSQIIKLSQNTWSGYVWSFWVSVYADEVASISDT